MTNNECIQIIEESMKEKEYDCLTDYLVKDKGISLQKYNSDIEYEMKLDYKGKKTDLNEIYKELSLDLSKQNLIIDSVGRYSDYDIEYFTNGEEELSLFVYENKPMLKIKKHKIKEKGAYSIFCNEEKFEYDINAIKNVLFSNNVQHLAAMNKKRIKDFLIDKENLIIYASALTLCSINNSVQIQYELEYYRHIPVDGIIVNDELIYNELSKICSLLNKESKNTFIFGSELKCDFAKRYYSDRKSKEEAFYNVVKENK